MYAIAQLIEQELAKRNWRKSELVAAMGYKNIAQGLKRLKNCLQHGDCSNAELLTRLAQSLELPRDQLNTIVAITRRQRADEGRARAAQEEETRRAQFRPYLYVRTSESRPSFITAAAVIGPRVKYLYLDNAVFSLPRPLLLSHVAEVVREHYRSNLGKCLLFGEITGYALRIAYDETVEFDTDGTLIQERHGWTEVEGYAMLRLNKHAITDGLFGIAI